MTGHIEVLKLGKLSYKKNVDNLEREDDERDRMDISDYKESDEGYHIDKNY